MAEKELTRRSDELAQWRQKLPWVRIDINDEILYYEWNGEHKRRQQQKQRVFFT
jgi:predicted dithiol-disulfide oxidoreductase (DUF899 family)